MKQLHKGVRLDKGLYVQVRISCKGVFYTKNFGADCDLAREMANIHAAKKYEEILYNKFGKEEEKEMIRKKFKDVADMFLKRWSAEQTPEGLPKHTPNAIQGMGYFVSSLSNYFGKDWYDSIRPKDIKQWRERRVKEVLGSSVDREQGTLSSIFSHVSDWVAQEEIEDFELPTNPKTREPWNPCETIEKAGGNKRERIFSTQELSLLKKTCISLNDPDMWEICKMALQSLLRKKDLMRLEAGLSIDMDQAKTGKPIHLPVQLLRPLNYVNFRKRWKAVRKSAHLLDCQFRDLRKTGATLLKGKQYSDKLISEYLGHTNTQTTQLYLVKDNAHLKPLAADLKSVIENL